MEVESWSDTLKATEDGNLCPQYDISQSEAIGKIYLDLPWKRTYLVTS